MNIIQKQDVEAFAKRFALSEQLYNKNILITGSTGLVGSMLAKCIIRLDKNAKVVCPVRNEKKARLIFEGLLDQVEIVECDLVNWVNSQEDSFDYIIHCASPTAGSYMKEQPVETISYIYESTKALLEYSRNNRISGFVFVSSVEYYGQIDNDMELTEDKQGYVDVDNPRNSYPMGKRLGEFLCKAYAKEYDVPVMCARLTQTFGSGVSKDDNRVFAQFVRSVIHSENIVLHTEGLSAKQYCYITDTVSAILYILLRGEKGKSYNVANPDTFISIKDLALYLKETFNPNIDIQIKIEDSNSYAPATMTKLNTESLQALGWEPEFGLKEMFDRFIQYYKSF